MSTPNNSGGRKSVRSIKTHVTKSGKTIKLNRSLSQKLSAQKNAKANRKALRQADLPKSRVKRFLYHFQPKRMYQYWFSRDGAIMALKITGVGFIAMFLLIVGLFAYFRKDLPNLRDVNGDQFGGSVRYYDRTGKVKLWEDYDAIKRLPVDEPDISQYVKDATVAIEDKDFFKHGGFDVRGIMRAGVSNLTGGGRTQGGSTITQQLVKLNQNWTKDRSYTRKAKELILSVELERNYSKQEILRGYLNTAPYGNVQYGVEAATRDYFQKSAKDLTLDEAAFLAAIPQAPSYYSPYGAYYKTNVEESRGALIGRQHYVLDLMTQQGMISASQRDEAKKVNTLKKVKEPQPKYSGIKAPWFVMAAKKQLEQERGGVDSVKVGGWSVITSLDLDKQKIAEEQVKKGLPVILSKGGDVAAFVAEDVTTGQVVALVGGTDFTNKEFGQFNYANRPLPPGSSFKPYDYLSLIDGKQNVGAGSVIYDTQGPVGGYRCTNKNRPRNDKNANCLWDYDFNFPGPLTLRYSLGGSRNVPAVKAMLMAGVETTIDNAEKLGLKSGYKCYADETYTDEAPCYESSAIGDGAFLHLDEHVHGYASISRNGLNIPQTYILKITNASQKVISEWKPSKGVQVVRPESAYIVTDMLSDPNASYMTSGKPHRYKNWKFAMKTGTTNDNKDGWMMGYSSKYAAGVWVGYHTRQKVMRNYMEDMTKPIWQGWMNAAHDDIKAVDWPKPKGLQTLPAYVVRSNPSSTTRGAVIPSRSTDLFPSWYKSTKKTNSTQVIDKVSGKLATDCTPELAKDKSKGASANQFSIDTIVAGGSAGSASTGDKDDVHKCDDKKPSITLNSQQSGNRYILSVNVSKGTHPISSSKFKGTVNYILDGQILQSFPIGGPGTGLASFKYTPTFTGTQSIYAEVIDSVLYDSSSDSASITASGASSSISLSITGGGPYTASWNAVSGYTNYTICYGKNNSASTCVTVAATSYNIPSISGNNKVAYVQTEDGSVVSTTEPF